MSRVSCGASAGASRSIASSTCRSPTRSRSPARRSAAIAPLRTNQPAAMRTTLSTGSPASAATKPPPIRSRPIERPVRAAVRRARTASCVTLHARPCTIAAAVERLAGQQVREPDEGAQPGARAAAPRGSPRGRRSMSAARRAAAAAPSAIARSEARDGPPPATRTSSRGRGRRSLDRLHAAEEVEGGGPVRGVPGACDGDMAALVDERTDERREGRPHTERDRERVDRVARDLRSRDREEPAMSGRTTIQLGWRVTAAPSSAEGRAAYMRLMPPGPRSRAPARRRPATIATHRRAAMATTPSAIVVSVQNASGKSWTSRDVAGSNEYVPGAKKSRWKTSNAVSNRKKAKTPAANRNTAEPERAGPHAAPEGLPPRARPPRDDERDDRDEDDGRRMPARRAGRRPCDRPPPARRRARRAPAVRMSRARGRPR